MIQIAIANLPGIYREIVLLRDVEEFSVNESAEALGISVGTAKTRLHRARMRLQKTLAWQLKGVIPKKPVLRVQSTENRDPNARPRLFSSAIFGTPE
jgi:predicted DNA-binding protein (UPF0251 family)